MEKPIAKIWEDLIQGESIDFDEITDWYRYPGEMVCMGHGWYEPKNRALADEFDRRAEIKRKEWRDDRDKRAANGDPHAIFDKVIEKRMQDEMIILTIMLILLSSNAFCQYLINWDRTVDIQVDGKELGLDHLIPTAEGDVLAIGENGTIALFDQRYGDTLHTGLFDADIGELIPIIYNVIAISDTELICVGDAQWINENEYLTSLFGLIIKSDWRMNVEWVTLTGDTSGAKWYYLSDVVQSEDGFIGVGRSYEKVNNKSVYSGYAVFVDNDGELIWEKEYGIRDTTWSESVTNTFFRIIPSPEDEFLISYFHWFRSDERWEREYDVLRINADGDSLGLFNGVIGDVEMFPKRDYFYAVYWGGRVIKTDYFGRRLDSGGSNNDVRFTAAFCATSAVGGGVLVGGGRENPIDHSYFNWVIHRIDDELNSVWYFPDAYIEGEVYAVTQVQRGNRSFYYFCYRRSDNDTDHLVRTNADPTRVSQNEEQTSPTDFIVYPAYPNPFNSITQFRFSLPKKTDVSLTIYDVSGREVISLIEGPMKAGYHQATWNSEGSSAGVYFCLLNAGEFESSFKLVLMK